MENISDVMRQRQSKIDELSQLGVELYPHKYSPDHTSAEILEKFSEVLLKPSLRPVSQ